MYIVLYRISNYFSVEHTLDCRVGGLVTRRHNEVRDAIEDLATLA